MAIAYLGLGSNLGDRAANLAAAIALLQEAGVTILKKSSFIETDPVGGPLQNKFFNAVVKVKTRLSPVELLNQCQSIEQTLGRVRITMNGPRIIDLDILIYDRLVMDTPRLVIPHPRMFERTFVLEPFKEIEPDILKVISHEKVTMSPDTRLPVKSLRSCDV